MSELDYLHEEFERNERGMASHYLFLYNAVRGVEARHVFEFGAGMSTRTILDALSTTGGLLTSCSTEDEQHIARTYGIGVGPRARWRAHYHGLSDDCLKDADMLSTLGQIPLDLVLHDGSHAADVVADDLRRIIPFVRRYGLVLVHDTQHEYVGDQMRRAVHDALRTIGVQTSYTTLPYGFGLTVIRIEGRTGHEIGDLKRKKAGSKWRTIRRSL